MPRPIHFDMAVDNPERAMNFYRDIFGWKFEKWSGPMEYWMVTTGNEKEPGINGGFSKRSESAMPNMNTIGVSSVVKFSKMVQDKGGQGLDAKDSNSGSRMVCYCQDTEGNTFGIIEEDRTAK